ncbi:HipA domain-containing protein [Pseudarthrobacter albicanus]|uniref:HipA domain-containing protein n=1 Tax=Pseudarthrobacter albicanus TaxID=2823873 RepID=UPI001BAAC322|nr:HipA domain-containing protein [Pseudarthrobacter albicanus]
MENLSDFVDLAGWTPYQDEPAGENEKTWFQDEDGALWIFKRNRPQRSPNENATEFIASQIAGLLGVPAATVRLATLGGSIGCVSKDVKSDPRNQLDAGSLFIAEIVPDFDPKDRGARGHSLRNIASVLAAVSPPLGHEEAGLSATGWFAGFLVLDALIGNQDRHSENWSIEITPDGTYHLAPSYDHATSLGIVQRNPEKLNRLVSDPGAVRKFAARAVGGRFEGMAKVPLVEVASQFCVDAGPAVTTHWASAIAGLDIGAAPEIVARGKMSSPSDRLALELIRINKERLVTCLRS